MRFDVSEDRHLNVFRHYEAPLDFEDNITRALLCLMSKSDQRYAVTTDFLRMVANCLEDGSKAEVPLDILRTLREPDEIVYNLQDDVTNWSREEEANYMHPVLVLIEPEKRTGIPPDEEVTGKSRADATLTISSGAKRGVFLVLENKRKGNARKRQIRKYSKNLGARKLAFVSLKWKELYDRLNKLAENIAPGDRVFHDFLELVAGNPRLAGFTGLKQEHLNNPSRPYTKNLTRLLAEECVSKGHGNTPVTETGKEFSRHSSIDIDLYLPEQTKLLGNIGIRASRGSFQCKLIVGDFKYDPSGDDGGKQNAQYETHRGSYELCTNWEERRDRIHSAWQNVTQGGRKLDIYARARRRRVQNIKHYTVFYSAADDFEKLEAAVNITKKLQPKDRGCEIDEDIFHAVADLIRDDKFQKQWTEDRELLTAGNRYLTGSLHVFQSWEAEDFVEKASTPEKQVQFVQARLAGMAELLRAMSGQNVK